MPGSRKLVAFKNSLRFRLCLAACLAAASAVPGMPIEASHPVANFLRRLEEKGAIRGGLWSTLPRDASEIVAALREASDHAETLGSWDRRNLEHYLNLLDPDRDKSRLRRRDGAFSLRGTAEFYSSGSVRDSLPHPEAYTFGSFTPGLEITYGTWAYLASSGTVGMERSRYARFDQGYNPDRGLPYNTNRIGDKDFSGTVSTFDGLRLVVGVGNPDMRLEAGQDWNQWGPGHWQHATLGTRPFFWVQDSLAASPLTGYQGTENPGSYRRGYRYPGEGPPLPQIRLRFGSSNWEYTKIVAGRTGLWKDSTISLVAHRVQVRIGSWRFGATEMLAIGREAEWLLMLPGLPLRIAEHLGGDRDNASMSADVEWIWKGNGRFYGEFFLDDFSGPPLDFWGNKFSWMAGMTLHDLLGLQNTVSLEYARVDPWVYGHDQPGTQMQSYGALLGSALPPNSHALFSAVSFPLPAGLRADIESRLSQRDYRSGGSSIFDAYDHEVDGFKKKFLASNVETRAEGWLGLGREWRYFEVRGAAGWMHAWQWKGNPERTLSTPVLSAEIRLRY